MLDSIIAALLGGALVGAAASWLLWTEGRVAGVSGILDGAMSVSDEPERWRGSFIAGLVAGGIVVWVVSPSSIASIPGRSLPVILIAGVAVGYGTRMGGGCTSGHGVCGLSRLSRRSLAATAVFMATGAAAATLMGLLA